MADWCAAAYACGEAGVVFETNLRRGGNRGASTCVSAHTYAVPATQNWTAHWGIQCLYRYGRAQCFGWHRRL